MDGGNKPPMIAGDGADGTTPVEPEDLLRS
jgi:hypothetical protein